jgi:hypothetical protein
MLPIIVSGTTSTSNPRSSIRRENGLIRHKSERGSWEYEDAEFGDPERIEFDTEDLIDAGGRRLPEPEEILSDHREPREGSALAVERRLSAADQRAENTTEREGYREAG